LNLLFDTNTIIDFLKLKNPPFDLITLLQDYDCYTSVIVKLELLRYPDITPVEENAIIDLLQFFTIIPLTEDIENETILLSRTEDIENETILLSRATKLRLPDAIIGATAILYNAEIVTQDTHFLQCNYDKLKIFSL